MNSFLAPPLRHASRLLTIGFAALLLPHLAPAGIDLTPRYIDTFLEGNTFHR